MKHYLRSSRSLNAYVPALIIVGALLCSMYLLHHSEQLKLAQSAAETQFTDNSPAGLQIIPASGGTAPACTAGVWDSQNCRRCTTSGTWAANCTDYGGPGDPGYTNALWCSCSLRCTGGPNTCQAMTGSMNASPSAITSGDPSVVSWTSSYADSCTSSQFVTNGSVSGSALVYPTVTTTYTVTCSNTAGSINLSTTVTVTAPTSCTLPWGGTINSGQSTTAYQASSVAYGSSCVSQTRSCSNGTLSGTYQYQSCTVSGPAACNLPWGGSIASGQSTTAYQNPNVPYGSSCVSQSRTCTNGTLSGTYSNQSCTVNPPPAPTCSVTISPNPIARGGTATVSWTSSNATSFSLTTIGPVTPNTPGSTGVSPSSNTNYGGSVSGPGGSTTCPATLTVTQPSASINVLKL